MWKDGLKREMNQSHEEVEWVGFVKDDCICQNSESGSGVPDFALVHERKSFGADKSRIRSTAISVETRFEDAEYLKELITEATKQNKVKGAFIDAG